MSLVKSNESEESLMMCGRDFESRDDGAYVKEESCVYLEGGICKWLSDEIVKQPCIEGPCPMLFRTKKLTNGDRFRAMTNEELAEELRGNCNHCALLREPCSGCECDEGILAYLNQEATE